MSRVQMLDDKPYSVSFATRTIRSRSSSLMGIAQTTGPKISSDPLEIAGCGGHDRFAHHGGTRVGNLVHLGMVDQGFSGGVAKGPESVGRGPTAPTLWGTSGRSCSLLAIRSVCLPARRQLCYEEIHCGLSPSPKITIFPVACSVGQSIEVRPAATATFCEPPAEYVITPPPIAPSNF
jgi:hypothetical protein